MAGQRTLTETERAVAERLAPFEIDTAAMAAVSNVYRAASALRGHFERTALAPHDLTWTGWVVLWVVWIWDDVEARHVAAEAGISKGTLTGVASTLENRGLLTPAHAPAGRPAGAALADPQGQAPDEDAVPAVQRAGDRVVAPADARARSRC